MTRLLGIDVGGSKLALALGDASGRVLARSRRATQASGDGVRDAARIAADARALLAGAGVAPAELAAVGVSCPGPLDVEQGLVLSPPNLPGWDCVPLRALLADALRCPVRLENDANAAALAEWRFGAGRGCDSLVYLTVSTGIGGGLVLGGRLHRGRGGLAGEIGHAPVVWDGEPCVCGRRGCLEAYVGGAAWTRRLRAGAPESSRVVALAGGRGLVTPEHVVAAAREGDAFALAELDGFVDLLARALVWITFALAPDAIVLGTIARAAGEDLCFAPLRERVAARVWPQHARGLRIVPSALGHELPDLAGLCVALEGLAERQGGEGGPGGGQPLRRSAESTA